MDRVDGSGFEVVYGEGDHGFVTAFYGHGVVGDRGPEAEHIDWGRYGYAFRQVRYGEAQILVHQSVIVAYAVRCTV